MTNEISISKYVNSDGVQKWIEEALGDRKQQFVTSLISLVNDDVKLQDVDKKSLIVAAMTATTMGLIVNRNLGQAYIIPYKDKHSGKTLAQLQVGWKGFWDLAMQSGEYRLLNATDVRQGEIKKIDRLTGEIKFKWAEEGRDKLPVVGYVSFFRLKNGFKKTLYMTTEELKAHGVKYSQTMKKGFGLWVDDFDAMSKKTVIKLIISRFGPKNAEMRKAQERDQAVMINEDEYLYLDNKKESATEIGEEGHEKRLLDFIKNARTIEELEQCKSSCTTNPTAEAYEEKEKELKAPKDEVLGSAGSTEPVEFPQNFSKDGDASGAKGSGGKSE